MAFMTSNSILRTWLGLSDTYTEGELEWTIGAEHRFPLGSYTNFNPDASTNSGSLDCVDLPAGNAMWRMRGCSQSKDIVCMQVGAGRRLEGATRALPAPPEQTGADFLLQQYIKLAESGLKI